MYKIILAIWITTAIFTIIPNIRLAYKFYTKKIDNVWDAGFLHFMCLYMFVIVSIVMTVAVVHNLL